MNNATKLTKGQDGIRSNLHPSLKVFSTSLKIKLYLIEITLLSKEKKLAQN